MSSNTCKRSRNPSRFSLPLGQSPGSVRVSYKNGCTRYFGHETVSHRCKKSVSASKKKYQTRRQNKDYEEILMEWLNENYESDCDDFDPSFVTLETDPGSATEQEGSEGEETISEQQEIECNEVNRSLYYYGKNRFKWSKTPSNTSGVRTRRHNIVIESPTSSSTLS
ncbi:hypothetical protein HHI36_015141 [Cryptolaemus montrouzieri]|uniref:Uncharacterized protein n=1 Tax=Cryptolaemus montrouzieri TaxID=559131 RepID=A0ABD2N4Q3_9CUCU